MTDDRAVLVCCEVIDDRLTTTTKELLRTGRTLCDALGQPLSAIVLEGHPRETADETISFGADRVYVINGSPLGESHPELYVALLTELSNQIRPSIILLGHTDIGREVAPRLAARLKTAVVMDCTEFAIDPNTKKMLQTKPVYGGNAVATWISETYEPQIATLRPKAVMPAEQEPSRNGDIVALNITVDGSMVKSKLLETVKEGIDGVKLEEAKIIVAGGGGVGGSEGFQLLRELAQAVGGTVGVTRVPCDEGWMPVSLEIGQTGHIVNPKVYFAIGISGALQHMAGCSGSKWIVAVNKDPEAHIFKEADFGVIGDYRGILPPLIDECKRLKK